MDLLQISFAGGVLILVTIVLRALTLHRLPKGTFLALWLLAAARLLLPFSIPSPASVYTLAERMPLQAEAPAPAPSLSAAPLAPGTAPTAPVPAPLPASQGGTAADVWGWVWLAGLLVCGTGFLLSYLRCRRTFRAALPVEDEGLQAWLDERPLRRRVALRQSDRTDTPLTYGLVHPVILLPKSWAEETGLPFVLEHELTHIRRLDALWKPVLAFTACVHWFNPLAWCMLVLANRDMELRCDETVVRRFGVGSRSEYALALISLEEKKSGLGPFASAFGRNAIEERITAIMKIRKRSLAAILAAAVVVCCVGVGFATSAKAEEEPDLREYLTVIPGGTGGRYTEEESRQLFSLWFQGYEDMTVADYREKMRAERGGGALMELIERYSLDEAAYQLPAGREADALAAFNDYFFHVYEPLTADAWQTWDFDGFGSDGSEYCFRLTVLDGEKLTVGEYEAVRREAETILRKPIEDFADAAAVNRLSTPALQVELGYYTQPFLDDPDALLHAQFSDAAASQWDRLLSPYVPFGLTYRFDDPDHDGNGLTMWFEGKEVRGIMDEQEGVWITEHTGSGYPDGAVELYTVYTDGVLSGLRTATAEEQAAWDQSREQTSAQAALERQSHYPEGDGTRSIIPLGVAIVSVEGRPYPQATLEDYDALLTLRTEGYETMSLEAFNRRLLDWANENTGAWERICCDVGCSDFPRELTTDARTFASVTCCFSGTENGEKVRALYTGRPESDCGFSAILPQRLAQDEKGRTTAWCDLYYVLSYRVTDPSAATVAERDACVSGMMAAIEGFWQNTDFDTLLGMTKADVAAQLDLLATENSTGHVRINPVRAESLHFEAADERGID